MSRQLRNAKFRGDPGFLGDALRFVTKKVIPAVANFIPGGGTALNIAKAAAAGIGFGGGRGARVVTAAAPGFGGGYYMPSGQFVPSGVTPIPASMPPATRGQMEIMQAGGLGGMIIPGGKAAATLAGRGLAKIFKNPRQLAKAAAGAVGSGLAFSGAQRLFSGGNGGGLQMGPGGIAPAGYHYNKVLRRYEIAESQGRDVTDPRDRPRVVNDVVANRSMNPLNPRALGRAFSRVKGAQRWARKLVRFEKKVTVRRKK